MVEKAIATVYDDEDDDLQEQVTFLGNKNYGYIGNKSQNNYNLVYRNRNNTSLGNQMNILYPTVAATNTHQQVRTFLLR